ncbi:MULTISPECIES: LysR family transcriptional regulator [Paraburkholderia]|uniref:LysR family transcriptional regulator n=1 Tax=Paraburkholderia TaxID=1822464 RepID=UPI001B1CF183|nr:MULTISPECIES: LysR family transcriptional regulator [Paraburkholderia]MCP2084401.1 DNA-binding transcriptional LysR family regulator [Paraburkholderia sediminicola]MCX4158520.1 LysR family transcriptional regulator [Paraburkholderia aspalathi]MDN7167920.1 LysR family transcriptional regulator [Paraburkholderia sp. SECH2]MDQ6396407.1 LysR family transcriptional regulator [Paraburkholderia aspalathi]CAE6847226.1 HTH-type transcriptional activator CmpR [Paraburkholderia aspalathi]
MTPDQLITFAAVAEHRNISRAAVALHLSQPAVSGQLRQLQDEFGEPLYLRDGRGVRLTPAGEQLASYATRLRDTWRQAHAYRDALRGLEQGTLRIGASTTPASYLLPYLIADFHRHYPDVTLHTADGNTTEIVGALGSVDIAMIEGPVGSDLPPDTAVHAWREDEIVAIMPRTHPLAVAQTGGTGTGTAGAAGGVDGGGASGAVESGAAVNGGRVDLAAFGTHPLVLREAGSGVRQIVERAFARAGVPMRVALEIAGVEGVKEAVRAGMGIGFVSAMSMRHEDGALCLFSLSPEPLTRRLSILVPHASAPSRVVEQFLALCLADGP